MNKLVTDVLENSAFEPNLIDEILTTGRFKNVKANEVLISPGSQGNEMPLVLSGCLKVMRRDDNGREVFLYFLENGETCAMSITCCIENKKSQFQVIAEEDSILWMIPMTQLDHWIARYSSFRKFVFNSYQIRFDEMLNTIDSVTFFKMDERLYKYLLDKKQASGSYEIHKTHQQIAKDMNTSRVVVSRLLKKLEQEGKIEQSRNKIEVL